MMTLTGPDSNSPNPCLAGAAVRCYLAKSLLAGMSESTTPRATLNRLMRLAEVARVDRDILFTHSNGHPPILTPGVLTEIQLACIGLALAINGHTSESPEEILCRLYEHLQLPSPDPAFLDEFFESDRASLAAA